MYNNSIHSHFKNLEIMTTTEIIRLQQLVRDIRILEKDLENGSDREDEIKMYIQVINSRIYSLIEKLEK